jgi:hypothetical protein
MATGSIQNIIVYIDSRLRIGLFAHLVGFTHAKRFFHVYYNNYIFTYYIRNSTLVRVRIPTRFNITISNIIIILCIMDLCTDIYMYHNYCNTRTLEILAHCEIHSSGENIAYSPYPPLPLVDRSYNIPTYMYT